MRNQGEAVMTAEAEYLWGFTPRWSMVFFAGLGKTSAISEFLGEAQSVTTGGLGLRYRLARKHRLQVGVDLAVALKIHPFILPWAMLEFFKFFLFNNYLSHSFSGCGVKSVQVY